MHLEKGFREEDIRNIFEKKKILITGGAGALGRTLIKRILEYNPEEITVFSRDEEKQDFVKKMYECPKCKFIIGDIKDYHSIRNAVRGKDIVIHTAAFKYVDIAESQVMECLKTNVLGSMNVINAVKDEKRIEICISISTDKSSAPINAYGMSKCLMEKLFYEAGKTKGYLDTRFLTVRYGNVLMTTGSVVPKWQKAYEEKREILVTDPEMTRFFFTLEDSIDLIFYTLVHGKDGEIISTKMEAVYIKDLAEVMSRGEVPVKIMGVRPGEKKDECLIAEFECKDTIERDGKFIIKPHSNEGKGQSPEIPFTSNITKILDKEEIKELLRRAGVGI
jgi:UDP-glucose 4-epimerase